MKRIIFLLTILIGLAVITPARATTLSPLILEYELDPGQAETQMIKLYNETPDDLLLNGYIEVFTPRGENGEVNIVPPTVANQAVTWAKLPLNSVALNPDEKAQSPLIISVPKNAQPGGYYLAVMWETASGPKIKKSQVGVKSRVGTLVFLKVKGQAKEELKVLDLKLTANKNFYSNLPVDFTARLENSGNIHLQPQGFLIIKDAFGRVVDTVQFNPDKGNIMPQSVKRFALDWQAEKNGEQKSAWQALKNEISRFKLGRFSAKLEIEYGDSRTRINSEEVSFWVVPWKVVLGILGLILAVVIVRRLLRRKK